MNGASFHYLFKFIVIGDTGTSFSISRRRQVLCGAAVRRAEDQHGARCYHWCGVRSKDGEGAEEDNQVADLGYCGSGEL